MLFDFFFDLLAFSLDDLFGLVEVFVFVETAEDRPGAIGAGLEVRELDDKPGGKDKIVFGDLTFEDDVRSEGIAIVFINFILSDVADLSEFCFGGDLASHGDKGTSEIGLLSEFLEEGVFFGSDVVPLHLEVVGGIIL